MELQSSENTFKKLWQKQCRINQMGYIPQQLIAKLVCIVSYDATNFEMWTFPNIFVKRIADMPV